MACSAALLAPSTQSRPGNASTSRNPSQSFAPIIHYNIQPPTSSQQTADSARPRTPLSIKHDFNAISPIPGYAPKDYANDALKAYMTYLANRYHQPRYVDEILPILSKSDTPVHQFSNKEKMYTELQTDYKITKGMAFCIVEDYKAWKESLKNVRAIKF